MTKGLLREVRPHVKLYRDSETGIAWVENGEVGIAHSAHPNLSSSGSANAWKNLGHWSRSDRTKRCRGFIYNIDMFVASDELDLLAAKHCRCGGVHNIQGGK